MYKDEHTNRTSVHVQDGDETPQLRSRSNIGINCMDIFDTINMVNYNDNAPDVQGQFADHAGGMPGNFNESDQLSQGEMSVDNAD